MTGDSQSEKQTVSNGALASPFAAWSCLNSWNAWRSQGCLCLFQSFPSLSSLSSSFVGMGELGVCVLPCSCLPAVCSPSANHSGLTASTSPNGPWRWGRGLSIWGFCFGNFWKEGKLGVR